MIWYDIEKNLKRKVVSKNWMTFWVPLFTHNLMVVLHEIFNVDKMVKFQIGAGMATTTLPIILYQIIP